MKKRFLLMVVLIALVVTGCMINGVVNDPIVSSPTPSPTPTSGTVWEAEYYAKSPGSGSQEKWMPEDASSGDLSIPKWAETLTDQIKRVREDTGAPKVNIVAHSMGGLVTRYALDVVYLSKGLDPDVEVVMTFATPHFGIPLERKLLSLTMEVFSPSEHAYAKDIDAMLTDGEIMTTLNPTKDEAGTPIPKINQGVANWYSYGGDGLDLSVLTDDQQEIDTIKFPMDGCVTILESYLEGAENHVYYTDDTTLKLTRLIENGETSVSYSSPTNRILIGMLHGKPAHVADPENGNNTPDNLEIEGVKLVSRYETISEATKNLIIENIVDKNDYPIIFVHGTGVWAGDSPNSWNWMAKEIANSNGYTNKGIIY